MSQPERRSRSANGVLRPLSGDLYFVVQNADKDKITVVLEREHLTDADHRFAKKFARMLVQYVASRKGAKHDR